MCLAAVQGHSYAEAAAAEVQGGKIEIYDEGIVLRYVISTERMAVSGRTAVATLNARRICMPLE